MQDAKNRQKVAIWAPSHKQQYLLQTYPQYGELGLPAAEIDPVVCGTPANFNGLRVLAALLHGSQVVSVSQTLRR